MFIFAFGWRFKWMKLSLKYNFHVSLFEECSYNGRERKRVYSIWKIKRQRQAREIIYPWNNNEWHTFCFVFNIQQWLMQEIFDTFRMNSYAKFQGLVNDAVVDTIPEYKTTVARKHFRRSPIWWAEECSRLISVRYSVRICRGRLSRSQRKNSSS